MEKSNIQIALEQTKVLIENFEAGIEHYLSPNYQKAEVRKEFIDKFYTALGWDVNHDYQKNPFEQEVKIEKAQRQQGALGQKRADYVFFMTPNYKQEQFFVDAKKLSRTLRQNKNHKCKNIDSQINTMVYQLYGLSQDEISIVEKA